MTDREIALALIATGRDAFETDTGFRPQPNEAMEAAVTLLVRVGRLLDAPERTADAIFGLMTEVWLQQWEASVVEAAVGDVVHALSVAMSGQPEILA